MTFADHGLRRALAFALLLTVASQIFYVTVVSNAGPETALRPLTWFTELFAFTVVAITALGLAAQRPGEALLWSTLSLSGVLNLLQVSIGLSMFAPAMEARESVPQLFSTVLAGAFFLYFHAKLLLGIGAIVLGATAMRSGAAVKKGLGALAIVGGLAAIGLNLLGMIDAKSWTFAAGAAGTAASALVGLLLFLRSSEPAERKAA